MMAFRYAISAVMVVLGLVIIYYAISAVMVVLGLVIIYYEYLLQKRLSGVALGSLLILWAFVRLWIIKRYMPPGRR
jgi:hypothetical protein